MQEEWIQEEERWRWELEKLIMQELGYSIVEGEWHDLEHDIVVPIGWIYTGEGMVEIKRRAAEKKQIYINTKTEPYLERVGGPTPFVRRKVEFFVEAEWNDDEGLVYATWSRRDDEPSATAEALGWAIKVMKEDEKGEARVGRNNA